MITLNPQDIIVNNQRQVPPYAGVMQGREIANIIQNPNIPVNDRFMLIGETVMGAFGVISEQQTQISSLRSTVNDLQTQNNDLIAEREKKAYIKEIESEASASVKFLSTLALGLQLYIPGSLVVTAPLVGTTAFCNQFELYLKKDEFDGLQERYKTQHPGCSDGDAINYALRTIEKEKKEQEEWQRRKYLAELANRSDDYGSTSP